jgi:mono/diheme cytochrome c family protein
MRSALVAASLASIIIVASTSCGGSSVSRRVSGRAVFATECSACHSLAGSESPARQGGDLLGYRLRRSELSEFVREMPLRRPLSRAKLAAVVGYVLAKQRSARRRHQLAHGRTRAGRAAPARHDDPRPHGENSRVGQRRGERAGTVHEAAGGIY